MKASQLEMSEEPQDRIDSMRKSRDSAAVILQSYNNFRSTRPGRMVFAFEGFEDVVFYEVMAEKSGIHPERYVEFVCGGKDRVLSLRHLLARNTSDDADKIAFFVDRDFDDLKGHLKTDNIYCTDTYSIENIITGKETLRRVLVGELSCVGAVADLDIDAALVYHDTMKEKFCSAMRDANLAIFFLRTNNIYSQSVENDLSKYVAISEKGVTPVADLKEVIILVGAQGHLSEQNFYTEVYAADLTFKLLDPALRWRGKFNLKFFQRFLAILKEDRGRRTPSIFLTRKQGIEVSFNGSIIRLLSSATTVPETLYLFFQRVLIVHGSHLHS